MKLSTRSRYGIRFMLDLANHQDEGFVLLKDSAARQRISEKYLGQIVIHLRNAGLINSARGASGGYALSRNPSQIRLDEAVEALEGPLGIVDCTDECPATETCATKKIWEGLTLKIREYLAGYTIADLQQLEVREGDYII